MNAEAKSESKPKRPTFADDVEASTTGEIKMIKPSHIRADHRNNESRGWAPYEAPEEIKHLLVDGRCCFTLEEIEQRFASIMLEGQICEVEVSMGGDKRPTLTVGYLRHAAFLLAEVRGVLDQIPGMKGRSKPGVRAKIVPAPKSQDDWDRASDRNFAENNERLALTPVQFAFYCKRKLDMFNANGEPLYTRLTLAQKLSASGRDISKRTIDRHMQLLSVRPEVLLAVHEGRMKMSAALKQQSEKGEGTATGKLPGVPRKVIRARNVDKRPAVALTPEQTDTLVEVLIGDRSINDVDDDAIDVWHTYYTSPKPKRAALKPGESLPNTAPQTDSHAGAEA